MRAVHFEGATEFKKPDSMTDDQCSSISAYVGQEPNGQPFIRTVWMPNKEDIEAINAGRPIVVSVAGTGLPPMYLYTVDENGNMNQ